MTEICMDWGPGEARIAVRQNGQLIDFSLWRPGRPDGLGDLHYVRILSAAPVMKGAFGKLYSGEDVFVSGRHQEGALIKARVVRAAQGGKGPRLQPIDDVDADYGTSCDGPQLVSTGETPLEALALRYPDASILVDAPQLSARVPAALRERVQRVKKACDADLLDQMEALTLPAVELGSDFTARTTPTPALYAIDLDDAASSASSARSQFDRNIAVFRALALQIRLRNVNGVILIDPAGVPTRKRPALIPHLKYAFEDDAMHPRDFGATPSGLLELTRPRRRPPLHELLCSPHGVGLSALRQITRTMLDIKPRPTHCLKASIPIVKALEQDKEAMDDASRILGYTLPLIAIPDYPASHWSFS